MDIMELPRYSEVVARQHNYGVNSLDKNVKDIDSICRVWDGQEVWAVIDGMWRQTTIKAVCPSRTIEEPWKFVLHSKHDAWRHLIELKPLDGPNVEFENIQQMEFIDIPIPPPEEEMESLPSNSPLVNLGSHACPVHPHVSYYIRTMLAIIEQQTHELEETRNELIKKTELCDELTQSNDFMSQSLHQAQIDEESLQQSLRTSDSELQATSLELHALKQQYAERVTSLEEHISSTNDELNKAMEEIDTLNKILESQRAEMDNLRVTISNHPGAAAAAAGASKASTAPATLLIDSPKDFTELERSLIEANKRNCILEDSNRQLNDRLAALDEALQKTILTNNEGSRLQAASHSRECSALQREIDRLIAEMAARTHGLAPENTSSDLLQLREEVFQLSASKKTLQEKYHALERQYAAVAHDARSPGAGGVGSPGAGDVVELTARLQQLSLAREEDMKSNLKDIEVLSQRVASMERDAGKVAGSTEFRILSDGSVAVGDDGSVNDGDRSSRRETRDVVRLATSLKNEIIRLRRRIEDLEKSVQKDRPLARLASPVNKASPVKAAADKSVETSVAVAASKVDKELENAEEKTWWGGKKNYVKKTKEELRAMFLREAQLVAENARLTMLLNGYKEPTATTSQVETLRQEVHSLNDKLQNIVAQSFPGHVSSDNLNATQLQEKEREIKELKRLLAIAESQVNQLQPVLVENNKLREKLKEYSDKITALEAKANAGFWG